MLSHDKFHLLLHLSVVQPQTLLVLQPLSLLGGLLIVAPLGQLRSASHIIGGSHIIIIVFSAH